MSFIRLVLVRAYLAVCVLGYDRILGAEPVPVGTLEGRVFDADRGEYLEKARLTIEGTNQEVFTDEAGQYRFRHVVPGPLRLRVFYTGLGVNAEAVFVPPGATIQYDITLRQPREQPPAAWVAETVQLNRYVVSASQEIDATAEAINEQRFATTMKNVVATDEFGIVVDGTPGEILKFLPGVNMDYTSGEAREVSINGIGSANVPITVGGFDLASAASNSTGRNVTLDQVSVNSISRIEVLQSPTPESPGNALAGSVNLVPRSAFERSRPTYTLSAFLMGKSGELTFHREPGPLNTAARRITPGMNFSAVVPVTKRFGFTLSANTTEQYGYENVSTMTWRGVSAATTVAATATNGLPATTPDRPYLTDFAVRDNTRDAKNDSFGATVDYRLSSVDTLSASLQWTWSGVQQDNRTFTFLVQRVLPGGWGPSYTTGAPGGYGRLNLQGSAQDWLGTTWAPTVTWRHNGPVWRGEAGAGCSQSSLHVRSADKGYFHASQASRTGVTVSFDEITALKPNVIRVTDTGTTPIDAYKLGNYSLVNADDNPRDTVDQRRNAFASLRRDFAVGAVPVALKGGVDVRSSRRDLRAATKTFSFVGADGRASTTPGGNDDNAGAMLDVPFSTRPGRFGLPSAPWLDNRKYYDLYKAHPEYFTVDQNAFYRSAVSNSKLISELVSALYLRADAAFFRRRLQLVGGVRAEQTNVSGEGPLTDPTRNYQRAPDGHVLTDTAGKPLLFYPTSNALPVSQLTYLERGERSRKEYLRWFPSLNASYLLGPNLTLRGAYATAVGRPDFNQYANGLTLPDTQLPPDPQANRISVNNVGIKAWQSQTVRLRVEYYFSAVGQLSLGAYRRDVKNFFGSTVMPVTPEFLSFYGLDPSVYEDFNVATNYNIPGTVHMMGFEFDYRQALTFLPTWARGVQVFANTSTVRATGAGTSNFAGYVPYSINWGASLTRSRFMLKASWNFRDNQRRGLVSSGASIPARTYNWSARKITADLTGELRFRRYTVFGTVRNVDNAPDDLKVYAPNTPKYARFRQRTDYGASLTAGVRGTW